MWELVYILVYILVRIMKLISNTRKFRFHIGIV